uniref:Ubiquitin-like protease family profile domain-containing protein n=1 Tax=Cucumis melo TaxID=3656 RepID=A0A9I9CD12_CUCME
MNHKRVPKVATKGETIDESKIKSQMASKSIDTLDDANDHDTEEENRQVLEEEVEIEDSTIEKQDKDETSCRLMIGTKDNVVSSGTIFDYDMDGDNVKVSVDMLPMVIASSLFQEGKSPLQSDGRERNVGILQVLNARFLGTDQRQILMFPYNLGNHWCLVVIDFTKGTEYWMDPLRNQINNDVFDVVRMAFDISRRKKFVWRIIKCPKQGGIVEYGYYVMGFMHDIILSSNMAIIEVVERLTSTYSQDDLDVHKCLWKEGGRRGEGGGGSAKFMSKLNFDF